MLIARQLKKTNICEYLLYMWQIEDLIRAFQMDVNLIDKRIITPMKLKDEAERKAIYEWYESLIDMMRMENLQQKGHLQLNKNTMLELDEFHHLILKSGMIPAYNAKFFYVLPLITQFRKKADEGLSDIELCFSFQYGFLMLKLQKAEITEETLRTQEEISKFMVLLAKNYHAHKNGELDLE
ncbi:MAG: DUF4924 family protein [Paludibacter sp.]|nr:DUF4924 family protein [Paludibacter sp.]